MGVVQNVGFNKFPKQSDWIGKKVKIYFDYDTKNMVEGIVVRNDIEAPWETIFKVEDRYIRSTECQHKIPE